MKTHTHLTRTLSAFIAVGIVLALINFFQFRSLWLDEAFLGLAISDVSWMGLLDPLGYGQAAPIGFLFIEKYLSLLGNGVDWSLRIFPFFSYCVSTILLYLVSLEITKDKNLARFSTAFFVLSVSIIDYSSEVKQYMSDVMVTLILLYSCLRLIKEDENRSNLYWFGLLGAIAIWFSNIAVNLLFTMGLYIGYQKFKKRDFLSFIGLVFPWIVSFIIYYIFFIHNHPTKDFMIRYWTGMNAFLPYNIFSFAFIQSLGDKFFELFNFISWYKKLTLPFIPLFLIGTYAYWKNDKGLLFLLTFPIIVHLGLSYCKLYPFHLRLILYLSPLVIIIICNGYYHFLSFLKEKYSVGNPYWLPILLVFNLGIVFYNGFPKKKEEIKQILKIVNNDIDAKDKIYVFSSSSVPFKFYKNTFPNILKLSNENIVYDFNLKMDNGDFSIFSSRNTTAWVVMTHWEWLEHQGIRPRDQIKDALTDRGYRISLSKQVPGAVLYRADLLPQNISMK